MKKNIAALIKVKTLVTLVVIIVFAVLALRGDITPDNVMIVVSTVIAFYFGTQFEKKDTETSQTDHTCPYLTEDSKNDEDGGDLNV